MKSLLVRAILGAGVLLAPVAATAGMLDVVKQRGVIHCGVSTGVPGFSLPDQQGNWSGLDVDLCRGVAAAIFNDANKVKFVPLAAKDRFTALQSGEVDVLSRNTTWSLSRDTTLGLLFSAVNYYDGQGFMVNKKLNVKSAKELSGASICTQQGTTTELNLQDYFRTNNLKFEPVVFATPDEMTAAYETGRCDVYTTDASGLFAMRLRLKAPDDNIVLPEIISKEPLGPAVRQGDDPWFNVVRWTHYAMVTAEELGVTKANAAEMKKSANPEIKRLLGSEGKFGESLGLSNDWAFQIVSLVGNYGEVFEKNVGSGSRLKIDRGINNLWNKGGLQYAPPVR